MMPSPSIGSLPLYRDPDETNGRCVDHLGGETPELAAEKDQLRHKLSLLKKKMHSQAGSRRSQVKQQLSGYLIGTELGIRDTS